MKGEGKPTQQRFDEAARTQQRVATDAADIDRASADVGTDRLRSAASADSDQASAHIDQASVPVSNPATTEAEHKRARETSGEGKLDRLEPAARSGYSVLRTLIDALPDLIYVKDTESRFVLANAAVAHNLGLESSDELVGKTDSDFYAEDLAAQYRARERQVIQSGEAVVNLEEYGVDGAGAPQWGLTTMVPWRDRHGDVVQLLCITRDITDRKRAEDALKKTCEDIERQVEERTTQLEQEIADRERAEQQIQLLGQIAQQMKDAVILTDSDAESRIRYVNDAFSTLYGYRKDEVLGQSSKSLFAGDTEELNRLSQERRDGIARQGECRLEYQDRRKDGSAFWVSNTLSVVYLGERRYDLGIIRDITQRKQAEERLLRRNRELALINQVSQELTATLDQQRVAEHSLRAATEIIGAGGASIWTWDEEREGWMVCRYAFSQGQARSPINTRLPPGQGIAGWVAQSGESNIVNRPRDDQRFFRDIDEQIGFHTSSLLAVPLKVRDSVSGVLEVVNKLHGDFDRDDQVMAETLAASVAVAIDNARLIEALRQRTVQLEARNEELAAFGHTAAHDLKNPLARIVGLVEVLKEDEGDISSEELRRYLHRISQTGRKMSSIIDDLLLLAGIRQMDVEVQALDTASIVTQAQQRLAAMIEEYQADIILPDTWPVAMGYAPWVEEVWTNCLSNAIKYGGQPPRVELDAQVQPDGMVAFWIRDNGPGIPRDAQARLFVPFTRLDQVRAEGHGLGLSIVRRIVEKFGGQVRVESELGQGSTFIFTLPGIRESNT